MLHTLKKTAVIGLGGTGMHAVLYMKKKLFEIYGEIPPMIKFLVIDTTDKDLIATDDGSIALEPGEFLKLEVKNPVSLINANREVRDWLPANVPRFALHAGAKQVRALGRLAVFANAGPLEARVDSLISSVRDFRLGRSEIYSLLSDNILVNIVCSISGGTGSGALLDTAVLVRSQLASTDKLLGYFLLPDIFVGKPATDNVEPNAYGALREVSHFMDGGRLRYNLGGRTRSLDGGLFNAVYVVNKTNRQGIEYNNLNDIKEFLGMGLFLQSSATGKQASDIIDNLEAELVGKRWFGKPTVFSSFGISELVYPGDWYADLYTKKIALASVQDVFLGGAGRPDEGMADDFIRRARMREHNADDVIDALASPDEVRTFAIPADLKKELIAATFARRDAYIAEVQATVRDTALRNLAELKAEKARLLADELLQQLSKPKGLESSRSFLAAFIGQLTEFRKELNTERDDFDRQRAELAVPYDSTRAEADRAGESFFNTKAKLEGAFKKLKAIAEREARIVCEIERREKAIDFFTYLLNDATQWRDRLGTLREYCAVLTEELVAEVRRMQTEKRDLRPFVHELKPAGLTDEIVQRPAAEFLRWLKDDRGKTVPDLAGMRLADVREIMLAYGASASEVVAARNRRIDDILRAMSPEERTSHIERLDRMASPLWQYDSGLVATDKRTTSIYLFGVEDAADTVFLPDQIRAAIESPYEPAVVATGDPKRIVCLKVEAAVPAFVIHNMPRYREKYLAPNRAFSFHLAKDWENELPDLSPVADEEESRRYWSLALADPFNLVVRRGEFYFVKSEKTGERTKDYLIKLGHGRRESLRSFTDDRDLVEEVREAIEGINGQLGNATVTERLKSYGLELEGKAKRQTEEIRQMIELELGDIESYIRSLAAL